MDGCAVCDLDDVQYTVYLGDPKAHISYCIQFI